LVEGILLLIVFISFIIYPIVAWEIFS